jgi:hypothetical protein
MRWEKCLWRMSSLLISIPPEEFALLELPLFNIVLSRNLGLAGNARLAEAAAISLPL